MTADESPKDDDFPVGMRVLAVDDDPTCLKLLESLLRLCKYHVTTTSQAITALRLLRENKDRFDLVLSDVHMPDMDGFKLLELIGLEMDLPVIMMSVNGETSTVMKGITHGACDYLLKPIRLEELRNIWQHVIRRRKVGSKNRKQQGNENANNLAHGANGVQDCNEVGQTDNNCKLARKRRDQNNEEDDEEDDEYENEDQSSQKKPRVVWSVELHQKFVAAVNQLGIDKAFPKRILDIMNVDKLTRENVASHLQKYRLYLKRMANQQGNMTPLGARDSSFLPMGSIGGFRDFHSLGMTGQFSNTRLASLQGAKTLGSLNSSRDLAISAPNSPGMIPLGHMPTLNKTFDDLRKTNHISLSGNQHGNMLQGLPMFSELDCLQNKSSLLGFGGSSTLIGDSLSFSGPQYQPTDISSFSKTGLSDRTSSNTFLNVPDDPLMMQLIQPKQHQQGGQYRGTEGRSAIPQENIYVNSGISSGVPDLDRCNHTLQNTAQLMGCSTASAMAHHQKSDDLATSGLNNNNLLKPLSLDPNVLDLSSFSTMTATSHESAYGRQLISTHATGGDENMRHLSLAKDDASKFSLTGNAIPWSTNSTLKEDFNMHKVLYDNSSNTLSGSSICSAFQDHQLIGRPNQYSGKTNDVGLAGKDNFDWAGQGTLAIPLSAMQSVAAESTDGLVKLDNHLMSNTKFPGIFENDGHNCLEDMVNAVMRRVT